MYFVGQQAAILFFGIWSLRGCPYGRIKREAWLREARDNNNSSLRGPQHADCARDSNPWAICTERRKIRGARTTAIESLSALLDRPGTIRRRGFAAVNGLRENDRCFLPDVPRKWLLLKPLSHLTTRYRDKMWNAGSVNLVFCLYNNDVLTLSLRRRHTYYSPSCIHRSFWKFI